MLMVISNFSFESQQSHQKHEYYVTAVNLQKYQILLDIGFYPLNRASVKENVLFSLQNFFVSISIFFILLSKNVKKNVIKY